MHIVLASGPWYESGTFWTGTGAIAAIVFAFAGLAIWRIGPPRRRMVYSIQAISLLPNDVPRAAAEAVTIMHGDVVLTDPRSVMLSVESRARRDIASSDFDQGRPLEFDLGTVIAALLELSHEGVDSPIVVPRPGDRSVKIPPALIRKGPIVRVHLLVDGKPQMTLRDPLISIDVRDKAEDNRRSDRIARAIAVSLFLPLPVVAGFASGGGFASAVVACLLSALVGAVLWTVTAVWNWLALVWMGWGRNGE